MANFGNPPEKIDISNMSYDEFCIAAFGKDADEMKEQNTENNGK